MRYPNLIVHICRCFRAAWSHHCNQHSKLDLKKKEDDIEGTADLEEEYVDDVSPVAALAEAEWVPICSERQYTPTAEDVGHIFRLECSAISTVTQEVISGPVVIFSEPVLAAPGAPPRRPLSTIPGAGSSANGQHRFRVLSYNILAEVYATRHVYPYCDPWSLYWPYRRSIILAEIAEAQGDLVCLQEVQADYYEHDILPRLTELGYDGIFKQKTRESMGQHGKVDGCAVFWRRNKFIMLQNYAIEFNECARHTAAQLGVDETEQSRIINRLSRDNVAQVVVFEVLPRVSRSSRHSAPNSNHLCVVNTHLYANHTRPDVKLWQSYTLMKELEQFVVHQELALLICGDFNSEPSSSVYQFLSEGTVDRNHEDLAVDPMKVLPDSDNIIHSVDLSSVMVTAFGSEPEFTNYTKSFKGTLDYIWYTPGRLRVLAVTNIPQEGDITEHGEALPSVTYPSDHIMLSADMCLAVTGSVNMVRNPAQPQRKQNVHSNGSPPPKTAKNQVRR